MRRAAPALLIFSCLLVAAFAGDAFAKNDEETLTGQYIWDGGGSRGPLKAVFTPAGQGLWDVSFYFNFSGQPHTYTGTAEGSLTEGRLEGKVVNENKRRTFTFEGTFDDGQFRGTHAEYKRNREYRTGTLTLER